MPVPKLTMPVAISTPVSTAWAKTSCLGSLKELCKTSKETWVLYFRV